MSGCAVVEPPLCPDQVEALGEEIATFAARIDAATHALLARLRVFDANNGWARAGFKTCAQWLAWRTHICPAAAREKVRVARALASFPKVDELFRRGQLSYSKVRAITRVATAATEQDLIDVAMHATAAQIERLSGALERTLEPDKTPGGLPRNRREFVRRIETVDGMVRFEMLFSRERADVVSEALEAVLAQEVAAAGQGASAEAPAAELARASAEAPAAELARPSASAEAPALPPVPIEQRRADAMVDLARAYLQHRPRTLGSAYELVVFSTPELLDEGASGVGGFLRDGTPVPLQVARMLAVDGARVDVRLSEEGEILDVGRRTRAVPAAITRALWLRDGGCRVPGCGHKRHVHAHHIHGWAQGGPTKLANLVMVCSTHHRMIHEGELDCAIEDGKITFIDARGRSIPAAPPPVGTGRDLEELDIFLRRAELYMEPSVNAPRWDGRPMDLADTLGWMLAAHPNW